ncbi:hypothetical protein BUALT_Bualt03G0026600 [Buddleja alternifolia]|uniref:Uncharacterized protein n=1 Tax=Buddleja alternifolia TaxID=168488 RepID=A0AAV6Y1X9_9LAMI|nr:hypothetical protein BUALT_Bualt03G0026600 [Buddleja alternifolia]
MSLRTKLKHLTGTFPIGPAAVCCLSYHSNHRSQPPPKQDPHSLLKEDPIQMLSNLCVKSFSQTQKPFQNLSGFLSKLDLWVLAYQRACAHATGSFPPKNALPAHTLSSLLSLQNAVVHSQFQWNSKVDQFIRNPNDKTVTPDQAPIHVDLRWSTVSRPGCSGSASDDT